MRMGHCKLKRRLKPGRPEKTVKKSNLEIIDEQKHRITKLKMEINKLTQVIKIKNDKIDGLNQKISLMLGEEDE